MSWLRYKPDTSCMKSWVLLCLFSRIPEMERIKCRTSSLWIWNCWDGRTCVCVCVCVLLDFRHTALATTRNIARLEVTTGLILRIQVLWFLYTEQHCYWPLEISVPFVMKISVTIDWAAQVPVVSNDTTDRAAQALVAIKWCYWLSCPSSSGIKWCYWLSCPSSSDGKC